MSLAEKLYKACGIEDPDNVADLQDAADTYLEVKSPDELISEIKKNLYVTQVKQEHKNLYTQDWQRVYTTNYDEIPILSSKESEKKVVIIENYYNYIEVLEKFSRYELKEIQFILTARTVLYDTRILEANTALRIGEGESRVINLNKLSDSELSFLSVYLKYMTLCLCGAIMLRIIDSD